MTQTTTTETRGVSDLATINIGNINEGAIVDGFEVELARALANIADLSTPASPARVVTIQVVLKPHGDRVVIETEIKITSKLCGMETHKSKVFLGRAEGGGFVAVDGDPRQMPLWTSPKPTEVQKPIEFKVGN